MESPLITHIFIETFFNHKGLLIEEQLLGSTARRQLFESYGVFNGCEGAADDILFKVLDCDKNQTRIVVSPKSLSFFINKVIIQFLPEDSKGRGAYDEKSTKVNEDGTFDEILIYLNRHKPNRVIFTTLIHELTHAYQDYCLRQKGSTLEDYGNAVNYNTTVDYMNGEKNNGPLPKNLATLMYLLNQFETGANITSMVSDVREALKNNHFDNVTQAIQYIKKHSTAVDYYNKVNNLVKKYCDPNLPLDIKQKVVRAANRVANYNFTNFKQFSNWAKSRTRRILNSIEKKIPKIVNDNLQVNHFMPPYGIEDIDLEIDEDKLFEWKNDY